MTREILQLHFEKVIHVYTKMVITKMENGNSEILNVPRESRGKLLKKYKKNTKKKKTEKSKLFTLIFTTIQSDITKNSIIYFFLNYLFRNIQKWNDHLKIPQISSWHFSFQIGKRQCLHAISNLGHGVKAIRAKSFCKRNAVT